MKIPTDANLFLNMPESHECQSYRDGALNGGVEIIAVEKC